MTKEQQEQLAALVRGTEGIDQPFRPRAYFDGGLDCIRVIARDCSVLEERITRRITVLKDTHAGPDDPQFVGFTFKGAAHFCKEMGWDASASVTMGELLDAIVQRFPEEVVKEFVNAVARPLMRDEQIESVELHPMAA